jgi:hypothetical protein
MRTCLRVWLAVVALAVSLPTRAAEPVLRTGDVVFQTSRSRQSAAISHATASRWTHTGIVEVTGGRAFVIEAIGRVSRTPWKAFRRRGQGEVLVLRPRGIDEGHRAAALEQAKHLLGRPYDARFGWGDDRIYCSELVRKAYARGAGVALGRMERLGDLRIAGLERAMVQRWGKVPRELRLVTPASIAADPGLEPVWRGR